VKQTEPVSRPQDYVAAATVDSCAIFSPFLDSPRDRPFIVAQIGQSLDGRIATVSGESRDISGEAALDHLHRLRAHVDAVVVGAGTIAVDDPQLTVRRIEGGNPARVVIDPNGRLGSTYKWQACDGVRRILISAGPTPVPAGIELIQLAAQDGRIAPAAIVAALFARGLRRVLIEGGPWTIAKFIEAGCINRLHVLVAPVIIGSGRQGFELSPVPELKLARRPHTNIHLLGGGDVLFDCDLSTCLQQSN
jgi:riboflavin-specific deaminase-like protein